VINQSKITWELDIFKPFMSVGTHGIVPVLLQQGEEHVVPHLCRIFRACMAYGFIHIILSSVLLKTMEKLVDRHIRNGALPKYALHRNQHAYQIDKSTETALQNVVTRIENAIEHKEHSLT
jgi:hypothetical protein